MTVPVEPLTGEGVRCMLMRGGSSKGAYFVSADLPSDAPARDDLLLRVMGSPDSRQIDGIGGGHPLTSKIAIVSISPNPGADVDYYFLQVDPARAVVTDRQTCGNLLAGVAPFAIERGLVDGRSDVTQVRVRSLNPVESFATVTVHTPGGVVLYGGNEVMAGAPFPAAPIAITFAGSGSPIFPTGRSIEQVSGVPVTLVDAGMPVVLVQADELGIAGDESPAVLEGNHELSTRVERIRTAAAWRMGLGDVRETSVPKICLVSPPRHGGTVTTRVFIPHRVHSAVGALAAVSVAAGIVAAGTVVSTPTPDGGRITLEHPSGQLELSVAVGRRLGEPTLQSSTLVRTARKLMDGTVWPRPLGEPP